MKAVKSISAGLLLVATAMFTGCGPSAEDILKKYESHATLDAVANKAGISLDTITVKSIKIEGGKLTSEKEQNAFAIEYSHPALHKNADNIKLLNDRFVMLRADKPEETVTTAAYTNETEKDFASTRFHTNQDEDGFFLIGFKGIDASESAILATPPCFFIVSCKGGKLAVLTQQPLLANGLFAVDYSKTHFNSFTEPQTYSGTINFEKSKDVTIDFTLSADGKQVTDIKFSAGELYLSPKNKAASSIQGKSEKSKFKFAANASATTSFGNNGIEKVIFSGGIENTMPFEVSNGKLSYSNALYFDLSVTDACLYGTIQAVIQGSGTQPVYAVFKNVTTPQDIPAEILNPKN